MLGLKKIKAENAPDSPRDRKVHVGEAEQTSDDTYLKKSRLRHFFSKLLRTKGKRPASSGRDDVLCVSEARLERPWIEPQSPRGQRRVDALFQVLEDENCEPESDIQQHTLQE